MIYFIKMAYSWTRSFLLLEIPFVKKTILILTYTPTLSHISRPLEVAKKLKNLGFNIIFGGFKTKKSKLSFIENEGFRWLSLYEPDPDTLFSNIRNAKLNFLAESVLMKMIKDDLGLFKRVQPDLILTDGRLSAMISSQISNIPHAAIVNGSSTQYRSIPYVQIFFQRILNKRMSNHRFLDLCDRLNLKIEMAIFNFGMNTFTKLSKRYNLNKNVTATNCLTGADLTLIADIPEYFPVENQPASYHYIGPITWKPSGFMATPKWWPLTDKNKYKIYITMGTTGEDTLFSKVYEQFKNSDFLSIITTGSQADHFKPVPGTIYIENYMDGAMVLNNSDLVVCHGGNGTIYQALSAGKLIIGIPTLPDQDFNMRRVETLGLGIRIPLEDALKKPDIIIQKTKFILKNMGIFKNNVAALQNSINQYSGADTAALLIQSFLNKKD